MASPLLTSDMWETGLWTDALKVHPMFAHLTEECCERDVRLLVCESRGDLFVWDSNSQLLLTTNLKRLHSRKDETGVYQVCMCERERI